MTSAQWKKAYLYIFDSFAANTAQVAAHIGETHRATYTALVGMTGELLCDELQDEDEGTTSRGASDTRKVGKNILWQCWNTYDTHTRTEAANHFEAWWVAR